MTLEIDNANTRRDETEKSNGTQRNPESRTVVLLLPTMLPSIFYVCCLYLVTVSSTVQLRDLLVSKWGTGGPLCGNVFKNVEGFIFMPRRCIAGVEE